MSSDNLPAGAGDAIQRVLEARARALSRPPPAEGAVETTGVIVIALGREQYGLPLRQVREVRTLGALTLVPGTPPMWSGLVNLRGRLCPVLDLGLYLGLPAGGRPPAERAAVPDAGGNRPAGEPASRELVVVAAGGFEVALMVDDVRGMREVLNAEVGPLVAESGGLRAEIVTGVTADLLTILDLDALLSDPRLVVQDESV